MYGRMPRFRIATHIGQHARARVEECVTRIKSGWKRLLRKSRMDVKYAYDNANSPAEDVDVAPEYAEQRGGSSHSLSAHLSSDMIPYFAAALASMTPEQRGSILEASGGSAAAALLDQLTPSDRAAALQNMSRDAKAEALMSMDPLAQKEALQALSDRVQSQLED